MITRVQKKGQITLEGDSNKGNFLAECIVPLCGFCVKGRHLNFHNQSLIKLIATVSNLHYLHLLQFWNHLICQLIKKKLMKVTR